MSGTVFVGARNHLHQLDADLRPQRTVVTGPRLDSRLCTESFGAARCGAGGTAVYDALPTDNVNKVGHFISVSAFRAIPPFHITASFQLLKLLTHGTVRSWYRALRCRAASVVRGSISSTQTQPTHCLVNLWTHDTTQRNKN